MTTDLNSSFDFPRFEQLLAHLCNDTLPSDECEELENLVATSPTVRAAYWERMFIHARLQWTYQGKVACENRLASFETEIALPTELTVAPLDRRFSLLRMRWLALTIAAGLLVALSISFMWRNDVNELRRVEQSASTTRDDIVLGELVSLSGDSLWSFGAPGGKNRKEFRSNDTLWLNQGAAELRLTNGTVVQLESPLILQMVSLDIARLLRGRITADVAQGEEGFTVETAAAEIIDLGTTFSVDVTDSGETDVIVFQGQVDVNLLEQGVPNVGLPPIKSTKRLLRGEALRVTEDGTLSRIVNVRRPDFSSVTGLAAGVIKEVRDNVTRGQTMKYYEIVAGGMGEDAVAFVDRAHEWNGADKEGIPSYLLGSDYVKTFNDDKVNQDLRITITLERPADLYLLVDDRLEDTNWLLEQFEDTGDDIGLDEGTNFPNDPRRVARRAGVSIDEVHSIWKSREVVDGTISVGPFPVSYSAMGRGTKAKLNMFGIVAVPSPSDDN